MNYRKIIIFATAILLSGASVLMLLRKPDTQASDKSLIDKRNNTIMITTNYLEQGEFDRALLLLEELLITDPNDNEARTLFNTILEQKDTMHMNHRLMQLQEVDISGSAKLKTYNIVNGKIQELIKSKFQTMFIEDRMFGALPNLDSWIMLNWTNLNRFANINNNGS